MKKFNLVITSFLLSICAQAQTDSNGRVSFYPVVNNASGEMPQAVSEMLESKMQRMVTTAGFGSSDRADRFVLVAKPSVVTKDIAPTTPPRISQTVELTFVIGDVVENKTYASCALSLSGVGINDTKAWSTAISKIKPENERLRTMFSEAFGKIEAYYADNCESIIAKARIDAGLGDYGAAMASLFEIPEICASCYDKAQQEALVIYQQKIDADGKTLLSKATAEWTTSLNPQGARNALQYLAQIDPNSAAYVDKEALEQQIASKLSEDERRKWELEVKRYNDEMALRQKEQQNRHQRQMADLALRQREQQYSHQRQVADDKYRREQETRRYNDEQAYRQREQELSHQRKMADISQARHIAEKWLDNQPQTNVYLNW